MFAKLLLAVVVIALYAQSIDCALAHTEKGSHAHPGKKTIWFTFSVIFVLGFDSIVFRSNCRLSWKMLGTWAKKSFRARWNLAMGRLWRNGVQQRSQHRISNVSEISIGIDWCECEYRIYIINCVWYLMSKIADAVQFRLKASSWCKILPNHIHIVVQNPKKFKSLLLLYKYMHKNTLWLYETHL